MSNIKTEIQNTIVSFWDDDNEENATNKMLELFDKYSKGKLDTINSESIEACKTVVSGYESDGMENMCIRDNIFYDECKSVIDKLNK